MAIHFLIILLFDLLVFLLEWQVVAIRSQDSREAREALHVLILYSITLQLSSRRLGGGHPLPRL